MNETTLKQKCEQIIMMDRKQLIGQAIKISVSDVDSDSRKVLNDCLDKRMEDLFRVNADAVHCEFREDDIYE